MLQVQRVLFHVSYLVDFQHHGLIDKGTIWRLGVAVWLVDADPVAVVFKEIDGQRYRLLVGL